MTNSKRFVDKDKSLVLTNKEMGGMRIRTITHGKNGSKIDFYLTANEVNELRRFLLFGE